MTGHDDEFEDFLRKRRPLFGPSDGLEPPAELDRIVLRQAREAIESEQPQRHFRAPSWGMPVALAATLVLAFTIILRVGLPAKDTVVAEVTVQPVARKVEIPAEAPAAPAAAMPSQLVESTANESRAMSADSPVFVDLPATEAEAQRARRPEKLADTARLSAEVSTASQARADSAPATAASAAPAPEWRRDAKTWLAEIQRLREAGDVSRADAELAEYNRQHRAFAVAPDR